MCSESLHTPHLLIMICKCPKFKVLTEVQSLSFEITHQISNLWNIPSFRIFALSSLREIRITPPNSPEHQQSREQEWVKGIHTKEAKPGNFNEKPAQNFSVPPWTGNRTTTDLWLQFLCVGQSGRAAPAQIPSPGTTKAIKQLNSSLDSGGE